MKIWSYSQSHRIDGDGGLVEKANKYFEACEVHGNSMDSVRTYVFGLITFFRWLKSDWEKFEKFTQKDLLIKPIGKLAKRLIKLNVMTSISF